MLRITQERQRQNLSQSKLARAADMNAAHLSALEAGKLFPYPGWVDRLSKALGVPGEDLFEEVDDDPAT